MKIETCPKCKINIMKRHRTLKWWVECHTCRYCKFDLEFIEERDHEKALKKPNQTIHPTNEELEATYAHYQEELVP